MTKQCVSWPVAIPASVATPSSAGAAAAQRFDRLVGRSIPLDQIPSALAEARTARAELLRAMKALTRAYREQRHAEAESVRAAVRYARDEAALIAERAAVITGERLATSMEARAA